MKLFVWDLHGTLEQGNENAAIKMSNIVLYQFGYRDQLSKELALRLYGLKWYQYFEYLLPKEPSERHFELQAACFKLANSTDGAKIIASFMKPSKNALPVLEAVHTMHEQVLISNTHPESIPIFVNALQFQKYFTEANSIAVNDHDKTTKQTKLDALMRYIERRGYDEIIVIGDSESDMVLARAIGAKGYLYAYTNVGFRTELGDCRIHDLIELLSEI